MGQGQGAHGVSAKESVSHGAPAWVLSLPTRAPIPQLIARHCDFQPPGAAYPIRSSATANDWLTGRYQDRLALVRAAMHAPRHPLPQLPFQTNARSQLNHIFLRLLPFLVWHEGPGEALPEVHPLSEPPSLKSLPQLARRTWLKAGAT